MGAFNEFPDGGVCLWTVCADVLVEFPLFLPYHGPTVDKVHEACNLISGEVPSVTRKGGLVPGGI